MVLSIVVKMAVKEVNINGKVGRVIVVEVGGAFALVVITLIADVIAPCCIRLYTIRPYAISEAIGKGVIVYRRDYTLGGFNWYWSI